MKKHIQNMERLWLKMQARYGESDDLVQRFRQDLSALQEKNAKKRASKGVGLRQADRPSVSPSVH